MTYSHVPRATIDFESRSAVDLRETGSWRYSLDPSTEVLCLAWRLPYWDEGRTSYFHPAFPEAGIEAHIPYDDIAELWAWIEKGGKVEAHGAWFERGLWTNILVARLGWPAIPHRSWMCSAAKGAALTLPRGLDDVAEITRARVQKDVEGHHVMMKMSRPREMRKAEYIEWAIANGYMCWDCGGKGKLKFGRAKAQPCMSCLGRGYDETAPQSPTVYNMGEELLNRLCFYCQNDVLAEEAASMLLPDLSDAEQEMYLFDQEVNERGFMLDMEAVDAALHLIDGEFVGLNQELQAITEGKVERATQRARILKWLESQGVIIYDTQKDTLDDMLAEDAKVRATPEDEREPWVHPLPDNVRRAIEVVRQLGQSSTAKYLTMKDWACPDGRARGGLLYHGAGTGRWSGAGIQPHNFPKGEMKDMELAWTVIKTRDAEAVRNAPLRGKKGEPYGDVMTVLGHALRGAIVPAPGKQLYVADFAAIEARVVFWLASDDEALETFRTGQDIYCVLASEIYGYPCNKNDHPDERKAGKEGILGLGFQMGWKKFKERLELALGKEVEEAFARRIVDAYRSKFWRVADMWNQYQDGAIEAVRHPGLRVETGAVTWVVEGRFLFCELPSGRRLAYPDPEVRMKMTPWDELRPALSFMGVNPKNHQWERQWTYGGSLVENVTQAVARDLMANGMLNAQRAGYDIILTVHDELIAEAPLDFGSVHEFEQLMATIPEWAVGCPVAAEGWSGLRYRK